MLNPMRDPCAGHWVSLGVAFTTYDPKTQTVQVQVQAHQAAPGLNTSAGLIVSPAHPSTKIGDLLSLDETGRVKPTSAMTNYAAWVTTEKSFKVRDIETLRAEIALINDLQNDFQIGTSSQTMDGFNIVLEDSDWVWVGGYDADLSLDSPTLTDILERMPPEEWTDSEKLGHACAHGYPLWLPEVMEDDTFDCIGFLQRQLEPGTIVMIRGAGHEGLRYVDGWIYTFDQKVRNWASLDEMAEDMRKKLEKEQKER